jgi:hypothetical protein
VFSLFVSLIVTRHSDCALSPTRIVHIAPLALLTIRITRGIDVDPS